MNSRANAPLAGHTVIELCQNVAGPYAGLLLAQLGADVIKVERPGSGDDTRGWKPPSWDGVGTMFLAMNAGKRSVALDLRDDTDRERLWGLIEDADVLIQSWRPGSLERLGFGPDRVRERRPELIYCSITAFGASGPLAREPGYDPLIQAFCGLMAVTGHPTGGRIRVGTSIIDMGTGLWAVIGILGALARRARTGASCVVEGSLLETGLAWLPYQIASYLATGDEPVPMGSGMPMLCPYQAFPAADREIVIAVGNDALWRKLCAAIGREDLGADPDLATNQQRVAARTRVVAELEATLSARSASEWEAILREAGVPVSVIQGVGEAISHEQTVATGILGDVPSEQIEGLRLLGLPISFDGARPRPTSGPPELPGQPASQPDGRHRPAA